MWSARRVGSRACVPCPSTQRMGIAMIEKGLEGTIAKVDAGLTALEQQHLPFRHKRNSNACSELVTPPSPCSLSLDSGSGSKSRRTSSRGQSHSKDGSTTSSEVIHQITAMKVLNYYCEYRMRLHSISKLEVFSGCRLMAARAVIIMNCMQPEIISHRRTTVNTSIQHTLTTTLAR